MSHSTIHEERRKWINVGNPTSFREDLNKYSLHTLVLAPTSQTISTLSSVPCPLTCVSKSEKGAIRGKSSAWVRKKQPLSLSPGDHLWESQKNVLGGMAQADSKLARVVAGALTRQWYNHRHHLSRGAPKEESLEGNSVSFQSWLGMQDLVGLAGRIQEQRRALPST